MRKLKVIQIGAEHDHAAMAMGSLRKQSDIFDLLAYAIPEGGKNINPKAYEGVPCLSVEEALNLPGLEGVVIETYERDLTQYAQMAADRGLHIHMDKPGGYELSDFEKLIATVKEKNLVFSTGYMYRHNPAVKKLMEQIKAGDLGEIYSVETHMNCRHSAEKREWLKPFPGGMLFFLGCHLIDLIYQIMGEPTEIIPLSCCTGVENVTADDFGMVVLKYPSGVSFAKTCATEPGGFMRRQLVVCGSKATVQLLPFEAYCNPNDSGQLNTSVRVVDKDLGDWHNDGERWDTEPYDRYDDMMRAFVEYVRGEKENPWSPDYELNLYKLVLKCCGKS